MNLSPIKRALLALALCLAVAACARGRRFERFPPAIDHDRVEQRMDAIRAHKRALKSRLGAPNIAFVDLDPDGLSASRSRIAQIRQREAAVRAFRERQFDSLRTRAQTASRARMFADRSAVDAAWLARLERARLRVEAMRRARLARRRVILERSIAQAQALEAQVAAVRARQQRIVQRAQ